MKKTCEFCKWCNDEFYGVGKDFGCIHWEKNMVKKRIDLNKVKIHKVILKCGSTIIISQCGNIER